MTQTNLANSPDLLPELTNAVIEAMDAHEKMSTQALNSEQRLRGILSFLLDFGQLYETLRQSGRSGQ